MIVNKLYDALQRKLNLIPSSTETDVPQNFPPIDTHILKNAIQTAIKTAVKFFKEISLINDNIWTI